MMVMRGILVGMAVLVLTGCSSGQQSTVADTVTVTKAPTTTQRQSMGSWKAQAADSVEAMGDALIATGEAMQAGPDFTAMRVGCADLRAASDGLDRRLPSPDRRVNAAFRDTIDNYRSASQICMTLGPTSSRAEIRSMREFIDAGGARMSEAFELLGVG